MTYSGGGFYNQRSGTWVSAAHASQHVGQVVNGWEKCFNHASGNYFMAAASGLGMFPASGVFSAFAEIKMADMFMDAMCPGRAQAKYELESISNNLSQIIALEKEVEVLVDIRLGGHDNARILTEEGIELVNRLNLSNMLLDGEMERILRSIQSEMNSIISINPQSVLSTVKSRLESYYQKVMAVNNKVALETGYDFAHYASAGFRECVYEVAQKHGYPCEDCDMPHFWLANDTTVFHVGIDIPAGEYYIEAIDRSRICLCSLISGEGRATVYPRSYVTVEPGQIISVFNGRFAMAKLLPSIPAESVDTGMWKVGVDLEPGNYIIKATDSSFNCSVLTTSRLDLRNSTLRPVEDGEIVNLRDGEYIELFRAMATRSDSVAL